MNLNESKLSTRADYAGQAPATRAKIMIVDDDEINVEVLSILLRDEHELAIAQTAEECLEKIEQFAPDLVLLDIMMPGLDGHETCRRIKSDCDGDAPQVILVSGKASTPERLQGYEVGADDYLVKPFDHDELLAKVRVQIRLRNAQKKLRSAYAEIQRNNRLLDDLVSERTAELCESGERLRQITENSDQVFWLTDWRTKELLYVSPAYERIFGRSCKSLYEDRRSWLQAVHPDDRSRVDELFAQKGRSGEYTELEYRIVHPQGGVRWICDRSLPIRHSAGEVYRWVGVAEDITARKRAEAELRERNVQLRNGNIELEAQRQQLQAQQVELKAANVALREARAAAEAASRAKSNFLANMSHEIRTPLTAILGFSESLLDPTLDESDRLDHINTIRRNGDHLLQVINAILDITKIEAGKIKVESLACSPARVLADVISLLKPRALAKEISLKLEFEGLLPETIRTDPTRLRQILLNLVDNAVKFTATGAVRIRTSLAEATPADGKAEQPPSLLFEVIDSGIGMTADQLERVFKPFTQADETTTRRFGGTGLGLAISLRLAEMLGGKITAESELGQGSTFRVWIAAGSLDGLEMRDYASDPAFAAEIHSAEKKTKPKLETLAGRILVAEDGPDNQRLFAFILRKAGAEVTIVENGELAVSAVKEAEAAGTPFDIVLMDMQMPVMDGYLATLRLRTEGYAGPIIALTAHALEGDRQRCLEAGCDDYCAKPIDHVQLIALIHRHLRAAAARSRAEPAAEAPALAETFVRDLPAHVSEFERKGG